MTYTSKMTIADQELARPVIVNGDYKYMLTIKEFCTAASISIRSYYNLVEKGQLKPKMFGNQNIRIPAKEFWRYVEELPDWETSKQ